MKAAHMILTFIVMLGLICTSCNGSNASKLGDYNMKIYTPAYASCFDIMGAEGKENVIISVRNPWQGAEDVTTQLFIARGGEAAPDGFDGQVLQGDAKRVVVMSTTHVAMLDAIGAVDRIVGVSGLDFISNESIRSRRASIGDVGYEGNVNYELLLSLNPDIVLLYGVKGASVMEGKLKELGIPFMYVGDYIEEDPLGKAEWLVALSEVVGMRSEGEQLFAGIPQRYNNLKNMVKERGKSAPKVMVNTPYGDSWFMPSVDSYAVRLIDDAGGSYVYDKNRGNASVAIDLEEAYRLVSAADMWINVGTASTLDNVKGMCPKFTDALCFTRGEVYNNNRLTNESGGNDYFESGVVNPDIVLRDLIKIFHPELVEEDLVYYQRLQ
ncbi:MAG: ABC transporter substrate-binding protein [Clostridiales bacterium]|nr:ABC transporter substrate-binding protein [Clostridiales bacterium]